MSRKHERRRVPYTPEQMFDLVADVSSYPDFIPWCAGMRVREDRVTDGVGEMIAEMIVRYTVFREKFKSRVKLNRPKREIEIDYLDGPLRKLENYWRFEDDGDGGCIIDFEIRFEFKNPFLQATATSFIDKAVARLSSAFIARAEDLYGPAGVSSSA